ncbi:MULTISPECIES: hypothetical protein [unclassified Pseudoclavibacter]|uniref:hypothetical protein n=1 Tax=unclassified Pseudoclavibacter TaxID=2615177 RepID=UPI001BA78C8E|nr:hypothetical protein [Pseudoclavibacter sp. Marseille-Q4354]MBS3177813.1 hypothetical protein [Pseudoclavibacter sp. Marseille-Q4354]
MTSAGIATAGGVHQLYLSRSVTIPASGSVQLASPVGKPYPDAKLGRLVMDAQIGGIDGKLTQRPDLTDPRQLWVFTRDAAGAAKTVAQNAPIVSLDKPRPGATSIFWLGSNNLDDMARVKDDTARMIELHQATSNAPFYVVELPPAWGGNEHPVTANRKSLNAWIKQNYGERVIPLADYLSNGALYDAGITRTQADLDAIARGVNPRSFWMSATDLTHMNSTGQNVAARYFARFVRDDETYSQAYSRFNAQSTMNVSVNGGQVTVSGHAFDYSDLFQSIPVGITVNGAWNATMASGASTNLFAYGIPGRHSYSMTFNLNPGKHFICSVGVNFGAGNDYFPACQTVTVQKAAAPIGQVMDAPASNRMHQFAGWTYTPGNPARSIPVAILVDGKWRHAITANRDSPYLKGVPGKHAFWTAAVFAPGKHSMCAVAIESDTNMTNLGCKDFVIK